MKPKMLLLVIVASVGHILLSPSATAQQMIRGNVPEAVARLNLQPMGRLPEMNYLNLAIGLPLRNREALTNLLQQLYDPASSHYHHYLTPRQFAEKFGPTEQDYQAVIAFVRKNGFEVTGTSPNRALLDVHGSVANIERSLHVKMNQYRHPTENRTFFAPDAEPSLDLAVPVLYIAGLNDFIKPRPLYHLKPMNQGMNGIPQGTGSAPGGQFMGNDFRAAYAPGVTLTGSGQTIGLFELSSGFYPSDITAYESLAGLPNVPVTAVLIDGYSGTPGYNNPEVSVDIEMAISMAPGVDQVLVYEGPLSVDILNRMATDDVANQISASWIYAPISDQIYQQFAAQGQSYFNSSGDDDAYVGTVDPPADDPNITSVGGTILTTSGSGGAWVSETVWNPGGGQGSGGGISTCNTIPSWQTNINMSANGGSTTMRNLPDVAMTADNIYIIYGNGISGSIGGTSCAAPLWAGFTALVNEQALAGGHPTVGFLNPALYAIGQGSSYGSNFHDITTGNNTNSASPDLFYAVPGYDLCTGWGTPAGAGLINALAMPDALQIFPTAGFNSIGGAGGPFATVSQTLVLTNTGNNAANWTLSSPAPWLTVSAVSGTLVPGTATNVTVNLSSVADTLAVGTYTNTIGFTNLSDSVTYERQYTLTILPVLVPELGTFSNLPVVFFPARGGTNFVVQMTTNPASGNWVIITNGNLFSGWQITNAASPAFFRLNIGAQPVNSIADGNGFSLFLKGDGSLWAMGDNQYGELGDPNAPSEINYPDQILTSNVTAIAAGGNHSLFLKSDGSLWAMGGNQYGEAGAGFYSTNAPYGVTAPRQIEASNVVAISAGGGHSLFLKSDGSLWAMGENDSGQLGDGTYNDTNLPEQIVASNIVAISAGGDFSLFLENDGSLWAMGANNFGELGDGTQNNANQSEQVVASNVVAIAAGGGYSLFLKSDSSLWGMGVNGDGELGDGTYNNTNQPEQIVASNVVAISAGGSHSLFLKSDGTLWGMGYNGDGELGDGTYNDTNQPEQIVGGNVTAITAGQWDSLFIESGGSLWGMGQNASGELGDGTYNQTNLPEEIAAIPGSAMGITTYGSLPAVFFPAIPTSISYGLLMTTNLASGNWLTVSNGISFSGLQITNAPNPVFFRLY